MKPHQNQNPSHQGWQWLLSWTGLAGTPLVFLALLLLAGLSSEAKAQVTASVSPTEIYEGEVLTFTVTTDKEFWDAYSNYYAFICRTFDEEAGTAGYGSGGDWQLMLTNGNPINGGCHNYGTTTNRILGQEVYEIDFDLRANTDNATEGDETIIVEISSDYEDDTFVTITLKDGARPSTSTDGVTISETSLALTELGASSAVEKTYTVVLDTNPTADVTITVANGDATAVAVDTNAGTTGDQSTLTFTAGGDGSGSGAGNGNWAVAQTVTVRALNDADVLAESFNLTHSATATGNTAPYHNITIDPVAITTTDAGHGVVVSESTLSVAENDETATYTVVLKSQPGGNVEISTTSGATGTATASPATLTFGSSNWNTPQTVTVTGKGAGSTSISHAVTTDTTDYPTSLTIPPVSVVVTSIANPSPSLTLSPDEIDYDSLDGATITLIPKNASFFAASTGGGTEEPATPAGVARQARLKSYVDSRDLVDDGNKIPIFAVRLSAAGLANITLSGAPSGLTIASGRLLARSAGDAHGFPMGTHRSAEITLAYSGSAITADDPVTITVNGDVLTRQNGNRESESGPGNLSADFTVRISDPSPAGLAITETDDDTTVSEDGTTTTDTYTVALKTEPTHSVTVTATASTGAQVAAAGGAAAATISLTFTTSNYSMAQTVTVTGVDDNTDNPGGGRDVTISHAASSTDSNYTIASDGTIEARVTDDDPTTVTLSAAAGNIDEGETKEFTITLGRGLVDGEILTAPLTFGGTATRGTDYTMTGSVAAGVEYNNLDSGNASVVFTGPQSGATATMATITLSAATDSVAETTPETVDIAFGTITNTGLTGAGGVSETDSLAAFNISDARPGAGVTVSTNSLALTELGAANVVDKTYTVVLDTDPTADVTITVASGDSTAVEVDTDSGMTGNQSTMTFTAGGDGSGSGAGNGNWAVAQTVTVRALNDADVLAESFNLTHSATATGNTAPYHNITIDPVAITTTDAGHGVVVSESSLSVAESDETATYTVVLKSQPSGNVEISTTSGATATATASPATLTFSSSNWSTPQTVTVTGKGSGSTSISHAVSTTADAINYPTSTTIPSVTVTADTRPTVSLGPILIFVNEGDNAVSTLTLSAALSADVTIPMTVANLTTESNDYTVPNPSSVTVTAGETEATFTIATTDDNLVETRELLRVDIDTDNLPASVRAGRVTTADVAITDNDEGVLVSMSAADASVREGGSLEVSFQLAEALDKDVQIPIVVIDTFDSEEDVTDPVPDDLHAVDYTVTIAEGDTTGSVTVTTLQDTLVEGLETFRVELPDAGDGGGLLFSQGLRPDPDAYETQVAILDDDLVALTESSGSTVVNEDGTTDSYEVGLRALSASTELSTLYHPSTVVATAGDGVQVSAAGNTPAASRSMSLHNLRRSQAVHVHAVDDAVDNPGGSRSGRITHAVTQDSDGEQNGVVDDILVTIVDDDPTTVTLSAAAGNMEEGETKEFTITLGRGLVDGEILTAPLTFGGTATRGTDYTMTGATADGVQYNNLDSGTATVVFTGPESGSTATSATITLSATADSAVESTAETVVIGLGSITNTGLTGAGGVSETDSLGDFSISDATPAGLAITETDDDTTVSEDGTTTTDTYTVALKTEPTHDVTVTATASTGAQVAAGGAAAAIISLTFTTSNYSTAQTVTVTGVDDNTDNPGGGRDVSISHAASSTDSNYTIASAGTIEARVTDDDPTTVTLAAAAGNMEEGETKEFTITLGRGLVDGEILTAPLTFGGTATRGTDYTMTGATADGVQYNNLNSGTATVVFTGPQSGATATMATITLSATSDSVAETTPETVDIAFGTITNTGLTSAGGVSETDSLAEFNISDAGLGAGVTVSTNSLALTELGAANLVEKTYTVVLDTDPTADVTITVANGDSTAVEVDTDSGTTGNQSTMTFTAGGDGSGSGAGNGNWGVAQTVTVRALNDGDGANESFNLTMSATVSDTGNPYHNIAIDPVAVTTTDAGHGLRISTTSVSLHEDDDQDTYTAALKSQPAGNVTISVTSGDATKAAVSPASLPFTSANWNMPQTVTLTGKGEGSTEITHAVSMSADATNYPSDGSLSLPSISVQVEANPGLRFRESMGDTTVSEDGTTKTDSYEIRLKTRLNTRDSPVDVTVSAGQGVEISVDGSAPAASATFRFTEEDDFAPDDEENDFRGPRNVRSTDWDQWRTITVTGVDDDIDNPDDQRVVTISHSTSSLGAAYRNIADAGSVEVTVEDDDEAGLVITESDGGTTVSEDGTTLTDTYTVALASEPSHDVTVTVTAGAGAKVDTDPDDPGDQNTLTFTSSNWNTAQTVAVSGVADSVDNPGGGRDATISHATSSTDDNYQNANAGSVEATVTDDEPTTVTLSGAAGDIDEGQTKEFAITLNRGLVDGETLTAPLTFTGTATRGTDYTMTGATADGVQYNNLDSGNASVVFTGPQSGATATTATITLSAATDSVAETTPETVDIAFGTITNTGLTGAGGVSETDSLAAFNISDAGPGAGVTVSTNSLALTELGAANLVEKTYTVVLDTDPTANVTITVTNGDSTAVEVDTDSGTTGNQSIMTFTAGGDGSGSGAGNGNWGVAQTVTVRALNDADVLAESFNLTHSATATGNTAPYHGITIAPVAVTTTDAGHGVVVSKSSVSVAENDETETYTVVLKSQPGGTVTITPTSGATATATVSPASLSFTNLDWNTPKTFTVTGKGAGSTSISHEVTTATTAYPASTTISGVTVTVTADPRQLLDLSTSSSPANEGTAATLRITATGATSNQIVAGGTSLLTFSGEGIASSDYSVVAQNSFSLTGGPPPAATATINLAADNADEPNETLVVGWQNLPSGYRAGTTATVTIIDQNPTTVTLAGGGTVMEDGSDSADITITLSRNLMAGETVTVPLAITGAGIAAGDYAIVRAPGSNLNSGVTLNTSTPHSAAQPAVVFTGHGTNTVQVATLRVTAVQDATDEGASEALTVGFGSGNRAVTSNLDRISGTGTAGTTTSGTATVTITDDDIPVITISGGSSVTEGTGASFTVNANPTPAANLDVTVAVTQSGDFVASSNRGVKTVTIDANATSKTYTVPTVNDMVDEANGSVTVTVNNGQGYTVGSTAAATVTVNDNDTAAVTIVESGGTTSVSEASGAGRTDTYTVALATQPTHSVTITPTSSNTAAATVSGTLTFTTSNWNTVQTVTVTGVDDNVDNPGGERDVSISHAASSTDPNYAIPNAGSVEATVTDDDPTTVTLSGAAGDIEEGQTKEFTIILNRGLVDGETLTAPLSFGGTATRGTDYTMTGSVATGVQYNNLNSGNANVVFTGPQSGATATTATITLSATSDSVTETTPETVDIHFGTITNTGLTGAGGVSETDSLSEFNISDAGPGAGVTVSTNSMALTELGAANVVEKTYTVVLDTDPTANVTITVTNGDSTAVEVDTNSGTGDNQSTMTFTAGGDGSGSGAGNGNWAVAQTVTVRALNDGDGANESFNLTMTATVSDTGNPYHNIAIDPVAITTTDAGHGVVVSESSLSVAENDETATYTVVLKSQPSGNVEITTTSGATTTATAPPATLTFGSSDWNTPQTVTVTGKGSGSTSISHAVSTTADATNYPTSTTIPSVAVTVTEVVIPTLKVEGEGGFAVAEGDAFTLTLTLSQPAPRAITLTVGATVTWDCMFISCPDGATMASTSDLSVVTARAVNFALGETTKTVSIMTTEDSATEGTELFILDVANLSPTREATIDPSTPADFESFSLPHWFVRILDDDTTPTVSIAGGSDVTEGDKAQFTVSVAQEVAEDLEVDLTVSDVSGSDFIAAGNEGAKSVTIAKGTKSATYEVQTVGDSTAESNGDITVAIASSTDYTTGTPSSAMVTVNDDDTSVLPVLSIALPSVEGLSRNTAGQLVFEEASTEVSFDVTLDPAPSADFTACIRVTETGGDRVAAGAEGLKAVTVPSTGSLVHTITWTDTAADDRDSVVTVEAVAPNTVGCSAANGAYTVSSTDASDSALIRDDDPTTVELTSSDSQMGEGDASNTATLTFSLGRQLHGGEVIVVPFTLATTTGARLPDNATPDFTVSATGAGVSIADENTASPSLTFTGHETNTVQTATVTLTPVAGRNDGDREDETITAVLPSSDFGGTTGTTVSGGVERDGTNHTQTLTLEDDDTVAPGLVITQTGTPAVTTVSEDGTTDTYTVALTVGPTHDVTVTVTAGAGVQVAAGGSAAATISLTFTVSNWNTAQTVTVTGVDNDVDEDGRTVTIGHATSSADTGYTIPDAGSVSVTVENDDTADVTIVETDGSTMVSEASGDSNTDTYRIRLTSQPTASVQIAPTSGDTAAATVSPATLTFTTSNWNTAQAVTVTGVDDNVDQSSNQTVTISHSATSADSKYSGISINSVTATVVDNDTVGVTIVQTDGSTSVTEASGAGNTDTYTMRLGSQPTASVEIAVTSGDTGAATVSPATLTFTTSNWNTAQAVTVTGVDDNVDQSSNQTVTISHSATSADSKYSGISINSVMATVVDNDTVGVTIVQTDGSTSVTEASGAGNTDTYTMRLGSQPTASVEIAVTSGDTGAATVSPATLTFTTSNWNTAQAVTVTGVDDNVDQSSNQTVTISHSATSADSKYSGISISSVTATVVDNDTVGVAIVQTNGSTSVTEASGAGNTDTYTMRLGSQPTASVEIAVTSGDTGAATVSPATLTFTTSNWNTAQTVTVTGVDDSVDQGNRSVTISHSATSADSRYNGIGIASVTATVVDDDTGSISINDLGGVAVTEATGAGRTDTYTVLLASQPSANVEIAVASGDGGAATVSPAALTFTTSNWNTAQTVTVTGVDDNMDQSSDRTVAISHNATSTDTGYNGVSASVTVTVMDDDTSSIAINEAGGVMVTEATGPGRTDRYTVMLSSQPSASVAIAAASADEGAATVSPATLTFNASNWNTAQTMTVTGVDDKVDQSSNRTVAISHNATSTDTGYNGLSASVTATVVDNDLAGVTITESGSPPATLVDEAAGGLTDHYTVVLNSQPTANVQIAVTPGDGGVVTVSPATLTFTASNWQSVQTVTVTGVDDGINQSSDRTVTISHNATSIDSLYSAIGIDSVTATVRDDDIVGVNIIETDGTTMVTEAAGPAHTDHYTVALSTLPTSTVTIAMGLSTPGAVTLSPAALTFTTSNWSTAQTVTVTAVDDTVEQQQRRRRVTITHPLVSSDARYTAIPTPRITATVVDDDSTGVTLNRSSTSDPITVTEAPGPDHSESYTLVMTAQPMGGDLTIAVASSDPTAATVSPATLTFTPSNWNTSQTVTVTGVDDGVDQSGNRTVTITHTTTSDNGQYRSLAISHVLATVVDNDMEVSITADDHDGTITEGEAARFTLTATPAPAAEQTIDVNVRITDSGQFAVTSQIGSRVFTITPSGTLSFSIPTEDDMHPEGDGRITATVETGRGYRPHSSNASASITVADNFDALPSVTPSTERLTVTEGDNASYTIALDAQPADGVAVSITVRGEDGTVLSNANAVDGQAVVSINPTLFTFTPTDWSTPQAVTITVPAGEGFAGEAITLSHTVARGNHQGPMTDVLVRVMADAALVEKRKKAMALRFGRTVSQQVVDALQQRLSAPPAAGLQLTVAGETVTGPTVPSSLLEHEGLLSKALGFNTVTSQALLEGSSFKFAPPQPEDAPRLGFWGQGALSSFDGEEDGFSLEGDVTTLLLGADWSTGRWQAGATISQSWGSGSHQGDNDDIADGRISNVLTGLFPYGRYALTPRLGLWATAGYGWGELSLAPDGEDEYSLSTTMAMTAAGLDGALLDGDNGAGITLNATANLMTVQTTSEEADGLPSSEGALSRLRLRLEAARHFPLPQGASLLPSMELGMRYDSGDAETGYGLDLGAGILWTAPEYGISGELKGHTLLTHGEEEFREHGLALSFSWEPDPSDRGPSLSLSHTMGATASGGMDALLNPTTIQVLDASPSNGQQFGAELAYGFPAYKDRITLTPAVALALSTTTRNYNLLWSVAPYTQHQQGTPWEVSLEGERQEQNSPSPVDHSLKLRFSTLF